MSLSKSLPFLPGHRFNEPLRQSYNKNQYFLYQNKTCLEKPNFSEQFDAYTQSSLSALTSSVTVDRYKTRESPLCQSYPRLLPQYIKFDKHVLKFSGYFIEHVVESAYENYRIRACRIYYYLEDDTIHITETKEENSGMPQGYFVKRHKVENQDRPGEYIKWKDFNLRSEIFLYGKKFRICDCDEFTRKFYSEKGIALNEREAIPEIDFEDKLKNVDIEENRKNIAELKEYIEVGLKGGHPNKTLKQFLENDRKVLNFDILWYDDKYDKEEKVYKMNYYLADGMIEIRETKVNNSGKDPFPLLLRKLKLPKQPRFSYCPGLISKPDEYYTPRDLALGSYIMIYNRPCHIIDCDEFTKRWFKQNLGVDMIPIKLKRIPPLQATHAIPPHNGFGSEEDSILSVYHLNPKKQRENMTQMFKQDKHILRFNAKLISPVPSDDERKFIISFFVRDGTIQVFEVAEKNSGRISGKFMERSKQKNPYVNKYYCDKDMAVGNTIYLNKYIFKLLECDDYTKKYMKDNPEVFIDSNVCAVIDRIRGGWVKYEKFDDYTVDILKELDPESLHYISVEAIAEGFKKFNIYLSTQEMITLNDFLSKDQKGNCSMEDLFNLITGY